MTTKSLTGSYEGFAVAAPRAAAPTQSLRKRLPLLIFALLGIFGAAFSWLAYTQVKNALRAGETARLAAAAAQVADLLGQSATARIGDAKRLAGDPEVQARVRSAQSGPEAPAPAAVLAFTERNPLVSVATYDGGGRLVGVMARGKDAPAAAMPAPSTVPPEGVSPLRLGNGRVSYFTTVPIPAAGANGGAAGYLVVQRSLSASAAVSLIERLIGSGAVLKLGNAAGDLWTDLAVPVAAPPVTAPGASATYRRPTGDTWIGSAVGIPGTPWLVWVEGAEATMLSPVRTLLRQMVPITLGLMVLGALAVRTVSGRITRPLEQVAQAAEAIASGDYGRRVTLDRRDEIGRLGAAFNVMAGRVAESHEALERRVAERTRELEQTREELDRFFSLSLDLLCISGLDGRFRRVNPAWEQVLGWTSEDLVSVPYIDFVHPDDRAVTAAEAGSLSEGATTLSFENRYRCKDGSYKWLSWKAKPLMDAGLIYAVAHDITDQKRAERALHNHGAALEDANRELEAFSYSVSHDLRAPLRHIDGFAQALADDYADTLDETGRGFLARIRAGAQRMGTLIDDLLSLSRVTRAELQRTDLDLTAMAREIAARLSEDDPRRRVEWRIGGSLRARGDARLLRIALDNLLGNAFKFTSKRDAAVIEFDVTTSPGGERMYVVRDNGAGFDMAHAAKLFGAFQRLHGVSEFPGTGIGLATVQRIVRRHGGRIWVEAAADRGATFFFTLEAQ